MLDRAAIIQTLSAAVRADPDVRAAWLGGSDANGRADERSDVDLFLVVRPGSVDAVAERLETGLAALSPIRLRLRLPHPTWHGFPQAFLQLRDAPPDLMVDWLMIEEGTPHPWLEEDRHGRPVVLVDRAGLVTPAAPDLAARAAARARRREDLRVRVELFAHLAPQQAGRGLPVDGQLFWQGMVLRPLVDALRLLHCPERYDYGLRYLRDDLPADAYREVCALAYPPDVDALPAMTARAAALFEGAMRALDAATPVRAAPPVEGPRAAAPGPAPSAAGSPGRSPAPPRGRPETR